MAQVELRELPKWPDEAKDLPPEKPPRRRYRWLYILAGAGFVIGFLRGLLGGGLLAGDFTFALGNGVGMALVLSLIGYVIDRSQPERE